MVLLRASAFARQLVHRRPILSASVAVSTSLVSYAFLSEYQAERQLREWRKKVEREDGKVTSILAFSQPPPLLPREFDWIAIYDYWSRRPVSTCTRMIQILTELTPIAAEYIYDFIIFVDDNYKSEDSIAKQRALAIKLREALTNLGPAFVKAGQQLSIRPDLVSAVVLKELQRLCDSVRPIDDEIALKMIREQLNVQNYDMFVKTPVLVASASLGQVYRATLRESGQDVAIKVQRPGMLESFSLDLFLLQHIGIFVDAVTSVFTNQPPFHRALYESFSRGSYSELDYENEAQNQLHFRHELQLRNSPVIIPNVYTDLTTQFVLTTEWIEGRKLADSPRDQIRELIPVGVELFLTQLLDLGKFHSGK